MNTSAVLLIFFRRPEQTKKVFEAIRAAKPEVLYLAADGPRYGRQGEDEACRLARDMVSHVDWPCRVERLFRETNVGIRKNVSQAISWFLDGVGEGVILEDDCLPHADFFRFAAQNLAKYRDDERVMQICGSCFVPQSEAQASYYFSRYGHGWGWATWKRAWDHVDLELTSLGGFLSEAARTGFWDSGRERRYWTLMFQKTRDLPIDTWDYQWTFTIWKEGGLSLYPNTNSVTNLGFGDGASNTLRKESEKGDRPHQVMGEIVHPSMVLRDKTADRKTFLKMYWGSPLARWSSKLRKVARLARGQG